MMCRNRGVIMHNLVATFIATFISHQETWLRCIHIVDGLEPKSKEPLR